MRSDTRFSDLSELRRRIEQTDLVPSRACLRDEIAGKFRLLEQQGITALESLRSVLKNARRLQALAETTGIDAQYLVLLRREIEGYFPKPLALKDLDWLPRDAIQKLEAHAICQNTTLFPAADSAKKRHGLAEMTGVDLAVIEMFFQLADLTRVQWVSPSVARMLMEAGYTSAVNLAQANAEDLREALERVNSGGKFFKGKIGLRDIKRLIQAAGYV